MKKHLLKLVLLSIVLVILAINGVARSTMDFKDKIYNPNLFFNTLDTCVAPVAQATNLVLTHTLTTINGSFTAEPSADHYLIVRSTMSTLSSAPENGTTYASGYSLGDGTVVAYSSDTLFTDINLNVGTQYYYYVFAATSLSCTGEPAYLLTSPLTGSTTCSLKTLDITAIFQEYYNNTTGLMNQTLGINWDTGDLFHNFGSNIVDTLTVLIRSTIPPTYIIEATFNNVNITTNGSIQPIYLNSNWNACPYGEITGYHHIVIKHRNSIETWSDSVDFSGQQINYNFFTHTPVEFAGGMYEDANGNFEIWGGDVNQNGNLESIDYTEIYLAANSTNDTVNNGYVLDDIDGNGNIDSQDYGLAYNNANLGANIINPEIYYAQPTNLTLTPNFSTVTGSFSTSETADHYLIVRSNSGILGASPVRGTLYTAGNTLGNGVVVAYQQGTSFTDINLNKGTYYYFIFAADTLYCTHNYLTTSPLAASVILNCGIPLIQPTNLVLTRSNTTVNGSFTASASADHYLIVRSTSASLTATPVSGTTYTAGNPFGNGNGTVIAYQTATAFADSNLNTCTQYYYYVFAANCTGLPQYLIIDPLLGNTGSYYCNCANALYPSDTAIQLLSATDTVAWYIYHAVSPYLNIVALKEDTLTKVTGIYIYLGNCNNLTLLDTARFIYHSGLYENNLIIGNNYYIKLTKSTLLSSVKFNVNKSHDILNCNDTICHDADSILYESPGYSSNCDLVCNGNFEYCTYYPYTLSQIGLACPWGSVNDATPDYFNGGNQTISGVYVPNNQIGFQYDFYQSLNHEAYAGIYTVPGYWNEYIYQKLKQPLLKNLPYTVSLKVSFADNYNTLHYTPVNNIGVFLSANNPYVGTDTINNHVDTINYIPSQTWIWNEHNTGFISDTSENWMPISYNFTPTIDSIQYITIGCFGPFYINQINTYYYIDEVHIKRAAIIIGDSISNNCTSELYTTDAGMTNYVWYVTGGAIVSGAGTNSITVVWNTGGPQTVSITYYNNISGCTATNTYNVNVTIIPSTQKPIISGSNNNCDTTNTYTASNSSNYSWCTIIDGITIQADTGNPITVTWPTDISSVDKIIVTAIDNNGCSSADTMNIYNCCGLNSGDSILHDDTITSIPTLSEFYINGTVTLNCSGSLFNQTVLMGPLAKIVVLPGDTLIITNGTVLKAGCRFMWDGIYINNDSSEVDVLDKSIIQDAVNGLYSKNGAPFIIVNAFFIDNFYNVRVDNNGSAYSYPGHIRSSFFTGKTSLTLSPCQGQKTFAGVDCKNVTNLTIGNDTLSSYMNTFNNMRYGVFAYNSDISVFNNEFENIWAGTIAMGIVFNPIPQSLPTYPEGAVYAVHQTNFMGMYPNYLTVGGYGNKQNVFSSCFTGVNAINYTNSLFNNVFIDNKTAISLANVSTNSTVKDNLITLSNMNTTNWHTGISIQNNNTSNPANLLVESNSISNYRNAIYMLNVASDSINKTIVHNNEIHYNLQNPAGNYIGINIKNCEQILINNNNIDRNPLPNLTGGNTILGIKVESTQGATLLQNGITQMGSGIYTTGQLLNTQFECNTFDRNYYGIQFGHASGISNQGIPDSLYPGNIWYNNINYPICRFYSDTGGLANDFFYYFDTTAIAPYNPNPFCNYSFHDMYTINNPNALIYCSNTVDPYNPNGNITTAKMRETAFGKTVRNQLVYDAQQVEFTNMAREYVYNVLLKDTTLINMGDTSDYVYQAFYNNMQTSDFAHLLNARKAMAVNHLDVAQSELNLIADTNIINHNRIIVDNMYLNTWALDNYVLTDDQVKVLTDIAYSDPFINGDDVYTARMMLNINPDVDVDTKSAQYSTAKPQIIKENTVKVYPNPAKETVTIAFDQPISGEGIVEIWNIMGNKLLSNTIPKSYIQQNVNVSSLSSGIYFYIIKVNGDKFSSGKIMIIK